MMFSCGWYNGSSQKGYKANDHTAAAVSTGGNVPVCVWVGVYVCACEYVQVCVCVCVCV